MLTRRLWSLVFAGVAILGASNASAYSSQVQCGNWTVGGINLSCAGPTNGDTGPGSPTFPGSNYWPGWAVLSLAPGANVTFDGKTLSDGGTLTGQNGSVGIWGAATFDVKGDARISGNAYVTSGMTGFPTGDMTAATMARVDGPNDFVSNFRSDVLLWRAREAALAAAQTAFALGGTPTNTFAGDTTLTQNLTITANAGNCIPIPGDPVGTCRVVVNFGGKLDLKTFKLVLDKGSLTNVDFVVNVGTACLLKNTGCGDLVGNGTSGINLAGAGLGWQDVLINVRDQVNITSDAVSPAGDNRFSGILIAGGAIAATGGDTGFSRTQWTGEIIGFGDMKFDNGSQITNPGGLISSVTFIPEPATLLLLLLVGTLLAGFHAWRPSGRRRAVRPA